MSRAASGEAVSPQDLPSGYEGLRVGFTAAVSHELRTPLARLLSLLDTAKLPGVDVAGADRRGLRRGRRDDAARGRHPLPVRARAGPRGRRAGLHGAGAARARAVRAIARARAARRAHARVRRACGPGGAAAAAHAAGRARQPARQRAALCRPRGDVPHRGAPGGQHGAARGVRRRRGRGPLRRPAPVRALLPLRSLAHDARHRPRARDRQAHHHRGRRHRRGGGRPGRGHPLSLRAARAAHGARIL